MHKVIPVYKPVGLTPLEVIKKMRLSNSQLIDVKIGYAGRLDPLAHGVLLLMVGEETKKREVYLSLPKTYEFEVVFGIQTDTYDLLGYVIKHKIKLALINVNIFVNTFVNNHIGTILQSYPPYSSKTVKGKALFWWARNGKLNEIEMPRREIEIFDFRCLSIGEITTDVLKQKVKSSIASVQGDFRQLEITERWEQFFSKNKNDKLKTARLYIRCSSGTYVRELVHQLGKEAGCGAIAIDILRTSVGKYALENTVKLIH